MDKNLLTVCIWLIKKLCIDMNAETAKVTQDMTFGGKPIGTYEITIKKIEQK